MSTHEVPENPAFPLSSFKWFLPEPRKAELAISIPDEKRLNLNQRLCATMPERITIGVSPDGKTICIKECKESGFRVPKSGIIKGSEVASYIKEKGIRFPCRYLAEQKNDCWIATLMPFSPIPRLPNKIPKSQRKKGLKLMLEERAEI